MTDCQAEVRKWRGHNLYVCQTCNIRTVDEGAFKQRCQSERSPAPPTSATGLYGPDDQPLPPPPEQHEPTSHDDI